MRKKNKSSSASNSSQVMRRAIFEQSLRVSIDVCDQMSSKFFLIMDNCHSNGIKENVCLGECVSCITSLILS